MADLSIPNTFVDGATITAAGHNANNDAVETAFNSSIASILSDSSTAGRIIVCNGSGVPQYVTPSGDVDVSNAGVVTLNQTGLAKTGSAAVQKGIAVDATERTTTSASYVALGSGFEVTLTTTANDIVWVLFRARWKTVGAGGGPSAYAQLQVDSAAISGDTQGVLNSGTFAYRWLMTAPTYPSAVPASGLNSGDNSASVPAPAIPQGASIGASDLAIWSAVPIDNLSAGSHTIRVVHKNDGNGTLHVIDRVLRAWVQPF